MNYDELEAKVLESIDSKSPSFAQKVNPEFEMSANVVPSKSLIGLGIGGGLSGIASGVVNKFSPIDLNQFGISGVVPLAAGTIVKLILKPKGMLEDVSNGLIVAGISEAVSGLTGDFSLAQERKPQAEKNTQIVPKGMNAVW